LPNNQENSPIEFLSKSLQGRFAGDQYYRKVKVFEPQSAVFPIVTLKTLRRVTKMLALD
jgi:hypothetical protein